MPAGTGPAVYGLEEHLLGLLLSRPDMLSRLDVELIGENTPPMSAEDFAAAENRAIVAALQSAPRPSTDGPVEEEQSLTWIVSALPDPLLYERCLAFVERMRSAPSLSEDKLAKEVVDSLLRLREQNLRREINQLRFVMMEGEEDDGREQLRHYQDLMVSYTAQKRHIQKLLNARTMAGALTQSSNKAIKDKML